MDKKIEDNRLIKPKHWKYIIGGVFIIVVVLGLVFRDPSSAYRVDREKITIDQVNRGQFQDYIRIIGYVEPISFVYLDAVEGGVVEEILIEEGSMVKAGDVILRLSNTNLNLSILNSEAQLAEKSNFLRETQINMEQQKLMLQRELISLEFDMLQKERAYRQNEELYKDELISKEEYLRSGEDFEMSQRLMKLSRERHYQDSIFRYTQVQKISSSLNSMQRNLELIYQQQENLNIKAPVDGQLGLLNAELGESIGVGQRIGQINVLTSYKIRAEIDEHYIDRIRQGLSASFERQNDTFKLTLRKVFPEVRDGRFEVNLNFDGELPQNIRAGQSYHIGLQLGESLDAVLIPRGGFFQSTGGQWVYVLTPDETEAVKRNIRIGKQNPQYYEVIEGLSAGEKVVTSSYDTFGDNDRLVFK
jgi:HlyD family secretion protein